VGPSALKLAGSCGVVQGRAGCCGVVQGRTEGAHSLLCADFQVVLQFFSPVAGTYEQLFLASLGGASGLPEGAGRGHTLFKKSTLL